MVFFEVFEDGVCGLVGEDVGADVFVVVEVG